MMVFLPKLHGNDIQKWSDSLKKEIVRYGGYTLSDEVGETTAPTSTSLSFNDISENVQNDFYFVNIPGDEKIYIYSPEADLVMKVPDTSISIHRVHSINALNDLENGNINDDESSGSEQNTKVSYESGYREVNGVTYYEPDLNNFKERVTKLVFYKISDGEVTNTEYLMSVSEWLNNGRPNEFTNDKGKFVLYDYASQIWANIRISNGTIDTNWVWIPRYAYRNKDRVEVKFVNIENKLFSKDNPEGDNLDEGYYVADSFVENTYKGLWVSKYEPSVEDQKGEDYTYHYLPDLSGFDKECTYVEIYNDQVDGGGFIDEKKVSEISNIKTFAKENLWFDYPHQIWANIKIRKNGIETWWVWIPRYAYCNDSSNSTPDIIFIDVNNNPISGGKLPDNYHVADAFKDNVNKGLWVGKYEPSYETIKNENARTPDLAGYNVDDTYIEIYNSSTGLFTQQKTIRTVLEEMYGKSKSEQYINSDNTYKGGDLTLNLQENEVWYDYTNTIWANIKVDKNGVETWWTYIPRYAYCNDGVSVNVILIDENDKPINGGELPSNYHVADSFVGSKYKGLWVGKYEPSNQ